MPLKKTVLLAFLLVISIGCNRPRWAGSKPAASPSPTQKELVDQIFDRYTTAVGGQEKIEGVTSFRTHGSFQTSVAIVNGTFESWGKNPNKSLTRIEFPQGGV